MIVLAKILMQLFGMLPATAPYRLARGCAGIWMRLSPGKRHVAQANLEHCFPDLETPARAQLLQASFAHYACSVLEMGRNARWPLARLTALCEGVEGADHLDRALGSKKGVLILAPHFGAWEFLGIWLQTRFDIAILYKPVEQAGLNRLLFRMRSRAGGQMLPATSAGLRRMYAHLADAKVGALLPDQQPSAGQGRFAPFFGIPALTGVLAPRLVQKTGCLVVFMVCKRLGNGRYRIHAIPAQDDMYSEDLDRALAAINHGVEQCIAIDPAQYLWSYKRFRARPEGELPLY